MWVMQFSTLSPAQGNDQSYSTFPQEIVDAIIDELAQPAIGVGSPVQNLRACALVSKAFHASASRHLFAKLQVTYDLRVERRMKRLREVLEANPSLLPQVRCLKIFNALHGRLPAFYKRQQSKLATFCDRFSVSRVQDDLVCLLQRFLVANISELEIVGTGKYPAYSSWTQFPARIAELLVSIAQSNSHIHTLKLSSMQDLPSIVIRKEGQNALPVNNFVHCFFSLSEPPIHIFENNFTGTQSSDENSLLSTQSLRRLNIQALYINAALPLIIDPTVQFPKLEFSSLSFNTPLQAHILRQVLTSVPPLLKELRLIVTHNELSRFKALLSSATPTKHNPKLPALKLLDLFLPLDPTVSADIQNMIQALSMSLGSPIFPLNIPMLNFRIYTMRYYPTRVDINDTAPLFITLFNSLDEVLCGHARLQRLKTVGLCLFYRDDFIARWCERVKRLATDMDMPLFPRLSLNGVVVTISAEEAQF
ncbi:hypothetical protein BDN70DRAFT_994092 [Pholiota conissans]|uniref:Uncharacterized protein n=1 Tax=Pholiota conissans TaxID=109636 RepID=A0A9P5Z0H9_9AGAR|nr:hypothetical protein BDN70DRAFT_994092 [Pholiota conissans]